MPAAHTRGCWPVALDRLLGTFLLGFFRRPAAGNEPPAAGNEPPAAGKKCKTDDHDTPPKGKKKPNEG